MTPAYQEETRCKDQRATQGSSATMSASFFARVRRLVREQVDVVVLADGWVGSMARAKEKVIDSSVGQEPPSE